MKKTLQLILLIFLFYSCTSNKRAKIYYMPDSTDHGVILYKDMFIISDSTIVRDKEKQKMLNEGPCRNMIFNSLNIKDTINEEQFGKLDVIKDRLKFYYSIKREDSIFFITKSNGIYIAEGVKEETRRICM